MNNRDLTIAGLIATGAVEVPRTRSSKYRVFRDPVSPDAYYFVGKSGALRFGCCGSKSISWTGTDRHRAYREIGNPAIRWESVAQARAAFERILAGRPQPAVSGYVDFTANG